MPSSRTGDAIDPPALARAGVRRITVDRPRVGFSDPQPGRVLLDWPEDVRVLADTLGLRSFAVLGLESGDRLFTANDWELAGTTTSVLGGSGDQIP